MRQHADQWRLSCFKSSSLPLNLKEKDTSMATRHTQRREEYGPSGRHVGRADIGASNPSSGPTVVSA